MSRVAILNDSALSGGFDCMNPRDMNPSDAEDADKAITGRFLRSEAV